MPRISSIGSEALFILNTAVKVYKKVKALKGKGAAVVAKRQAGYRELDPEIIGLDKIIENLILKNLEQTRKTYIVLTEEAGRLVLNPGRNEPYYFFCDPIDGSSLYRRQIPAFWLSSFSIWSPEKKPLSGIVINLITGQVDFSDRDKAYTGMIKDDQIKSIRPIQPSTTKKVSDSYIETYLMKPQVLYHSVKYWEPLLQKAKFILPNGGPGGFSDIARGNVDIYLAYGEGITEAFTGLPIALAAGVSINTLDHKPLELLDDINASYTLIATATPELMAAALRILNHSIST